jgi:hypothetical protein
MSILPAGVNFLPGFTSLRGGRTSANRRALTQIFELLYSGNVAMNLRTKVTVLWEGAVKHRSWLALVTFCATTAVVVALGMAIFFASVTVAFAVARTVSPEIGEQLARETVNEMPQQVPATGESFTGVVTDDHCGARHDMGSDKSPSECAKACVHNGAKYALVDGDKMYALEGNPEDLARAAGLRVTVVGSLQGDTIQVSSVTAQ